MWGAVCLSEVGVRMDRGWGVISPWLCPSLQMPPALHDKNWVLSHNRIPSVTSDPIYESEKAISKTATGTAWNNLQIIFLNKFFVTLQHLPHNLFVMSLSYFAGYVIFKKNYGCWTLNYSNGRRK